MIQCVPAICLMNNLKQRNGQRQPIIQELLQARPNGNPAGQPVLEPGGRAPRVILVYIPAMG